MRSISVLTPCRTLLLAGHDTSGTTLTWFFWELAKHPDSAREIREEIAAVRVRIGSRDFSMSDLEGMTTMLTAFKVPPSFRYLHFWAQPNLQESMRLHPIAWQLSRSAARDDVVPLAFPITTKSGEQISAIPIRKGTHVDLSFCSYGRWVSCPLNLATMIVEENLF